MSANKTVWFWGKSRVQIWRTLSLYTVVAMIGVFYRIRFNVPAPSELLAVIGCVTTFFELFFLGHTTLRNRHDYTVYIKENGALYRVLPFQRRRSLYYPIGNVYVRDKGIAAIAQARLGVIDLIIGVTEIKERNKDYRVTVLMSGTAHKPPQYEKCIISKKFMNIDSLIAELQRLQYPIYY